MVAVLAVIEEFIQIFFPSFTLLLSFIIFCGQGALSSSTDFFRLVPSSEVLCIFGSLTAHCSFSALPTQVRICKSYFFLLTSSWNSTSCLFHSLYSEKKSRFIKRKSSYLFSFLFKVCRIKSSPPLPPTTGSFILVMLVHAFSIFSWTVSSEVY